MRCLTTDLSWIIIPQAPDSNLALFLIFRKFAKLLTQQGAPSVSTRQQHRWSHFPQDLLLSWRHRRQICCRYQPRRKICRRYQKRPRHIVTEVVDNLNCEYLREVSKISKWVSGAARRWFKKKSRDTVLLSCQKGCSCHEKISKNGKNKFSMFQKT